MGLTCTDCGLEHDLDAAPDVGECHGCGGQLVEDDGKTPDRVSMMREIVEETVQNLAKAQGISPEEVRARLATLPEVLPDRKKGGPN